ncbi:FAD/NAD(P)-binding protein [Leptospira weilii]|uniref:FAD/NAD(P)-binding protein n=1 Tax=Leptospira weilii TaxID=28184 RepID=UPI000AF74408|nr:FAD/NAD(P)-binding protein [Leptospira weilii]
MPPETYHLAIVGGGPRATYAMERLSVEIERIHDELPLVVHIYELSGEFGSGRIHSSEQAKTSMLNRTCRQVSFAADETVMDVGKLRPVAERPILYEWVRNYFQKTGDPEFNMAPDDWPKRYQHGLALREMFGNYLNDLQSVSNIQVLLHSEEVVDILPCEESRFLVESANGMRRPADQVLLVTGHSNNQASRDPLKQKYIKFATESDSDYAPYAYPLEDNINLDFSSPDKLVAFDGMGLTTIDQILFLTEGRGGKFLTLENGTLRYEPCGKEPKQICAFSASGVFPFARPENYKERGEIVLEHKGIFFTCSAINRLREVVSEKLPLLKDGLVQLDFQIHVFPLVLLEMAYVHYVTLFGPTIADLLTRAASNRYENYFSVDFERVDTVVTRTELLAPMNDVVENIMQKLDQILKGSIAIADLTLEQKDWNIFSVLEHWLKTVFGHDIAALVLQRLGDGKLPVSCYEYLSLSPWMLETTPLGNRFSWEKTHTPVSAIEHNTGFSYKQAYLEFMYRDLKWADQGNICNPHKAAADGVWRDLRNVFSLAVDNDGLIPESHKEFMRFYFTHHNKLANGAGAIVMKKICALIESSILNVSFGAKAEVVCDNLKRKFIIKGNTGEEVAVDTLFNSRIDSFDAQNDVCPLYPNMLKNGLVTLWQSKNQNGSEYIPGYLSLDPSFHPITKDGTLEESLTILGPPAAVNGFFQFSALRPNRNHSVMREVAIWLDNFWKIYHKSCEHNLSESVK